MLPPLAANKCIKRSLVGYPKPGKNLSWVAVDLEDKIHEIDEKNNEGFALIMIPSPPGPNVCDAACGLLVDPCHFLPKSQLGSCVTNCKSLPQSKRDCAYKAYHAKDCSAVDHSIFS